jgi:hypothetical protein
VRFEDPNLTFVISECDELLTKKTEGLRAAPILNLIGTKRWSPIGPHKTAHFRPRAHPGEPLILFCGHHRQFSPL